MAQQIVGQDLSHFKVERPTFILHNATDEPIQAQYAGYIVTIPPVHVTGADPGCDSVGNPIPGTVVIRDIAVVTEGQDGDDHDLRVFPADALAMGILNVDSAGRAVSDVAKRGVSHIPSSCSPENIAKITAEGKKRSELFSRQLAERVVQSYQRMMDDFRRAGKDAPPPPPNYDDSIRLLRSFNNIREEQKSASMPLTEEEVLDIDIQLEAAARALAFETVEGLPKAKEMSMEKKVALALQLLEDPRVLSNLRKKAKLRIRKVGYVEKTAEELEKLSEEADQAEEELNEIAQQVSIG